MRSAPTKAMRLGLSLITLCLALTATGAARADDPPQPPLRWDPAWSHAGPVDYVMGGAGLVTLGVETVLLQSRIEQPRWEGALLPLDKPVQELFRGRSAAARNEAADASWAFWWAELGYPTLVDVPYAWARYGRQVAWDLLWQDAVSLSLSAVFDFTLRDVIARVRPINQECLDSGGKNCLSAPENTRSFPSGHVSEASTAAALICTQHLTMHLYGSPGDELVCADAIAADVGLGVLRLVTDNHYLSDEIGGAAIGLAFGWGLPVLMHLHGHAATDDGKAGLLIAPYPMVLDHGAGLGATAIF